MIWLLKIGGLWVCMMCLFMSFVGCWDRNNITELPNMGCFVLIEVDIVCV